MQRDFLQRDIKRITDEYEDIIKKLEGILQLEKNYYLAIKANAKETVDFKIKEILDDIPVEELNRNKSGIRIKALKDNGIDNLGQLSQYSSFMISAIRGISEDAMYTIRRELENIKKQATTGIKINLSLDHKDSLSTKVLISVAQYKYIRSTSENAKTLLEKYKRNIKYDLEDLKIANVNSFKWLLTGKNKQMKALEAYKRLSGNEYNELKEESQNLLVRTKRIIDINERIAWDDFAKKSVQYNGILEKVVPELFGTNDTFYGLPKDLAVEINDQCFFPKGLKCELRAYQEWGVKYALHQKRVLLGDEMGLGKTVQAIATMVSLKNTEESHFIVVCPASVLSNWCREIKKHSLLRVVKIHGSGRNEALRSWLKNGGVAVTTYETTGYINLDDGFKFSMLTVDEAHYIKNESAKRTQNVLKLCDHADRLLFMTGTALENKVDEMTALINILQPDVAASIKNMKSISSAPAFRNKIAPVYYRRKREDVLKDLPEKNETEEWCSMNQEEKNKYETAVCNHQFMEARRVSWNVDNIFNSSKARRLKELVEEAESDGRKIIVFSYFRETIAKVMELLGDRCTNPINGSISLIRRQQILDEFEKAGAGKVLPAQIQAGGTGLNIQTASVVIICEPQLKPSIENQAISRAYRMGQSRDVFVYRLLCEKSIDEKLVKVLQDKQILFDNFADKSVAAKESLEVSDVKFGQLINEEIERIKKEKGMVES